MARMTRLLTLGMALLIGIPCLGVDLIGPFNNTQTVVEYTTFETTTWLYALNKKDMPTRTGTFPYFQFARMDDASGEWDLYDVKRPGENEFALFTTYPHILGYNDATVQGAPVCMSIASIYGDEDRLIGITRRNEVPIGTLWRTHDPINPPAGENRHTRMAVSRANPAIQWIGSEWMQGHALRILKTSNGWATSSYVIDDASNNLAPSSAVFSLALDDRATPTQALCVLSDDLQITQQTGGDVHFGYYHCNALYRTNNAGTDWFEVTVPGWSDDMYNVHVAMVPLTAGQPNGTYRMYVLGIDLTTPSNPQLLSKWADWTGGGTLAWNTEDMTNLIESGTGDMPTYPFGLIAEWNSASSTFHILAATSEKLYYADHSNADEIPWELRMGSGDDVIRTQGFFDITVLPTDRANSFAVAGDECSYFTSDAGLTWSTILQESTSNYYASNATAVQGYNGLTELSNVCLIKGQKSSGVGSNLASVYVQSAQHQDEGSTNAYGQPSHIGYTYPNTEYWLLAIAPNDAKYYAAFTDHHHYSGSSTVGIVYHSEDEGLTWSPGNWPDRNFSLDHDNFQNPIPIDLVAHPLESNTAFLTFANADVDGATTDVPRLAFTTDGGDNWEYATGLPSESFTFTSFVAAGGSGTQSKAYVYAEDELWVSNSPYSTWTQRMNAPVDGVDLSVMAAFPDKVAIATSNRFYTSTNGGVSWYESAPLEAGYSFVKIHSELQNDRAYWAVVTNGTIWRLLFTGSRGDNWHVEDEFENVNVAKMSLYVEFEPIAEIGASFSRAFWSISAMGQSENILDNPDPTRVRYYERRVGLPIDPTVPIEPAVPVFVIEPVVIPGGVTRNITAGSDIIFFPDGQLTVNGSLVAGSTQGAITNFRAYDDKTGASTKWKGFKLNGTVSLTNCTLDGAVTGVETSKATGIGLSNCTITNCGTGLLAYQPAGTAIPSITGCTFINNDAQGVSLLATANTVVNDCEFLENGAEGMLLTNAYAKISNSVFQMNGGTSGTYGLKCFGSSPHLECNTFEENSKGEIGLYNQSYPVMEVASGGGKNTLYNDKKNLIDMWDSYPLTKGGHNNFTVGGSGYFMADMSAAPKKREISANYWNPTLGLSKLYPSSSSVYTWSSTDGSPNSCGGASGGAGAAQQMFADGMAAQSTGDYASANTLLIDVVAQYPDSEWASAALAQMFVTQCMLGDGYSALQSFLNGVADDSTLAEPAEAFATRLWVEDEQYTPALETYEETMTNPPSAVDSIFAAVDFAVASYRAQAEGGSLDEVNSADVKDIFRQLDMVSTTIPPSPEASHEGFAVIPTEVALEANFPNPFNAETTIRYYLPDAQFAEISIFNIVGQKVATLVSGQMSAGFHEVHWSGSDLASGVYLYQLTTGGAVETKKMVLLK